MKKGKPNYWLECDIIIKRIKKGSANAYNRTWYVRRRFFDADSDKEAIEKAEDIIERKALYLKDKNHRVSYAELNRRDPGREYMYSPVWEKSFKK